MANELQGAEPTMDPASLYREEVFTDRRVGTIRVLIPVTKDGVADGTRKVLYAGETQVLTPGGMLPITFEIEASSLPEAIDKFAEGVKEGVERTIQEIQELRREAASSIIVPGGGLPGGLGGLGGPPRGGKIQLS